MILVTGATGHFGKATIDFLLKKGIEAERITALVRDETKASDLKAKEINIKVGEYDNYNSLVKAFSGVDKLLLVSGSDIANRLKQQENAVNAAKEAGVKHIVYTSFERKNETDSSPIAILAKAHIETEKKIQSTGIPYTILRNNVYIDYLPMFIGEKVLETGVFFPAGDNSSAFALREDMAEAAANILTGTGHEGKIYAVSNTENISFKEIAAILSEASGDTVSYTSPDPSVYIDTITKAGVPAEYANVFAGFGKAFEQGEFHTVDTDLETLLGRKPTSVKDFLLKTYAVSQAN